MRLRRGIAAVLAVVASLERSDLVNRFRDSRLEIRREELRALLEAEFAGEDLERKAERVVWEGSSRES